MHDIVGHCPKCGAPIYSSPSLWLSTTPPPVIFSCACNPQAVIQTTASTTIEIGN